MRPRIGVTGPDHGGWPAWTATRIAVWRAGGHAVRITPSCPRSLDGLNGVIVGGGADVDPRLYKEDCLSLKTRKALRSEMRRRWRRRETLALFGVTQDGFSPSLKGQLVALYKLTRYRIGLLVDFLLLITLWLVRHMMSVPWQMARQDHRNRDELEVPLVRDAISRGIPILGICRGMQLINVCLGGSLFQEISVFYEESPILTTLLPRKRITVEPTSRLRQILRSHNLHVNSLHYQSVKSLGQGLVAVAKESNGIIQAIEHEGSPFIVGVQWHPEYLAFEKPSQLRLFRSLVEAARIAMQNPNRVAAQAAKSSTSDREAINEIANTQSASRTLAAT